MTPLADRVRVGDGVGHTWKEIAIGTELDEVGQDSPCPAFENVRFDVTVGFSGADGSLRCDKVQESLAECAQISGDVLFDRGPMRRADKLGMDAA